MAYYLPNVRPRFFDANGEPLSGGKLFSYIAGTTTPLATYSDTAETTPNTNPVVLDASGYAPIYLGNANYKLVLTDSEDVIQWTQDNIEPSESSDATAVSAWSEHALTDGQAATDLDGQTVDFATYSSAVYEAEVIRGTTVIANFPLAVQNLNGTGRVCVGMSLANEAHGLTFSLTAVGLVNTLRVACSSGPGAGTLKLQRKLVPV